MVRKTEKGGKFRNVHCRTWTFLNFPPFSVFLTIFYVLNCVYLIFCELQFSRHIPGPTVCISHFSRFTVIFHVLKLMFKIFHDFQCTCHIPRPTVDISKFSTFFSIARHISRNKVCISHFP